jgi:cold shock CspA family protein
MTIITKCKGKINSYKVDKGWGWISGDCNGAEVFFFFHVNKVISGFPAAGLDCVFTAGWNDKGPVATDVEVLPVGTAVPNEF